MAKKWIQVRSGRSEQGQTLVLVGASMLLLLLIAALAIDVGFWYAQRRQMQNAADAGALAGAWEICFGAPGDAEDAATEYAEHNGADATLTEVSVDTSTGTVVVTATTNWEPFLARSVVTDMTAGAVAAARCGAADEGCGMWPVAFDEPTYITTTLKGICSGDPEWPSDTNLYPTEEDQAEYYFRDMDENSGAGRKPGSQFILWAGDNKDYDSWDLDLIGRHCRFAAHPIGAEYGSEDEYKLATIMAGSPMDPGNRGWVALRPDKGYVIPEGSVWEECNSANNCGSALNCWLEHGYIGSIGVGDCLASQDGGVVSALDYADKREGDAVSILLYDHPGEGGGCSITENTTDTCGGNKTYHVSGIGCVRVEHVFDDKNCKSGCENIPRDGKFNSVFFERLELGGTDPWDVDYTDRMKKAPFGCEYNEALDQWTCDDNEPLEFDGCPSINTGITGIVVTKLCACPPTDCIGTGESGSGAVKAVSLIPVPAH